MLASQKRRQVSNPDDDPCSMNQETHTIHTLPSAYLDAYLFAVYVVSQWGQNFYEIAANKCIYEVFKDFQFDYIPKIQK